MKPFTYERARSSAEAAAAAARTPGSKFIAGGTNLLDLMKLQIETPAHLIDVNGLALDKIESTPGGGLRIGALTASAKVIDQLNKIRLPYNINTLSQAAAVTALGRKDVLTQQISLLISSRQRLYNELSAMKGITAYPSETNFILFRTATDAARIYEKLKEAGILIKNLNRPGPLKNCLRVTVGTPEENNELIMQLRKILKR